MTEVRTDTQGREWMLADGAWVQVQPRNSNALLGTARSSLEGMTAGLGDEVGLGGAALAAGGAQAVGLIPDTGESVSDIYGGMRTQYERERSQFREEHPALDVAGGLAGAVGTGLAAAPALARTALMQAAPKTASFLGGSVGGTVAGAGMAPDVESMPGTAMLGGLLGGSGSLLMYPLANMAGRAGNALHNAYAGLTSGVPSASGMASRAVREAMQRDDMLPADVVARQAGMGPDARLIDAGGENVVALGQGVATAPGPARETATRELGPRMEKGFDRIMATVRRELGADGKFNASIRRLVRERAEQAGPLYRKAEQVRVPKKRVEQLSAYLKTEARAAEGTPLGRALRSLDTQLYSRVGPHKRIKTKVGRELQFVKEGLDDRIGAAKRAGEDKLAARLLDAKRRLVGMMDEASPDYAEARRIYAGSASVEDSMMQGKKILREDAEDVADMLGDMSAADRNGYVIGAAKAIRNALAKSPDKADGAKRIAGNPALRENLRPLFDSDASFGRFLHDVATEDRFAEISNKLLNNSQTAMRDAAVKGARLTVGDAAADAATGNAQNVITQLLRKTFSTVGRTVDMPDAVSKEIGRQLFEASPEEAGAILTRLGVPRGDAQPVLDYLGSMTTVAAGPTAALAWQ